MSMVLGESGNSPAPLIDYLPQEASRARCVLPYWVLFRGTEC